MGLVYVDKQYRLHQNMIWNDSDPSHYNSINVAKVWLHQRLTSIRMSNYIPHKKTISTYECTRPRATIYGDKKHQHEYVPLLKFGNIFHLTIYHGCNYLSMLGKKLTIEAVIQMIHPESRLFCSITIYIYIYIYICVCVCSHQNSGFYYNNIEVLYNTYWCNLDLWFVSIQQPRQECLTFAGTLTCRTVSKKHCHIASVGLQLAVWRL